MPSTQHQPSYPSSCHPDLHFIQDHITYCKGRGHCQNYPCCHHHIPSLMHMCHQICFRLRLLIQPVMLCVLQVIFIKRQSGQWKLWWTKKNSVSVTYHLVWKSLVHEVWGIPDGIFSLRSLKVSSWRVGGSSKRSFENFFVAGSYDLQLAAVVLRLFV